MTAPLRILHCLPLLGPGGTERFATELAALQAQHGHRTALCIVNGSIMDTTRVPDGVERFAFEYDGSLRDPGGMTRFARGIRRLASTWKPDVVHSHLWPACRFATQALGPRTRHVWHIHDSREWLLSPNARGRFLRAWTRRLVRRHRPAMLAVSRESAEATRNGLAIPRRAIRVVPTAIDLRRFASAPCGTPGAPHIVCCSHFVPGKGQDVLVKALGSLRDAGVAFRATLAGGGSLLETVRAETIRLGLEEHIDFPGCIEDVADLLRTADVFVLPSVAKEGMPISILEAMAAELPVVATDVGGLRRLVSPNRTGLLCEPGSADGLASALRTLVESPETRASMGRAGRARVESRHDLARIAAYIERTCYGAAAC